MSARPGPRGGRSAMIVPTAIASNGIGLKLLDCLDLTVSFFAYRLL